MTILRYNGKYLKRGGKYANNVNCCCGDCVVCGTCKFSPTCQLRMTWSFTIADSEPDMYGSGETWATAGAAHPPIVSDFAQISGGTTTADVDVSAAFPTTGITSWTILLPYPGNIPPTFTVQGFYECDHNKWGFGVYGNNRLIHNDRGADTTFPMGNVVGSCNGASGVNAIFDCNAVYAFLATGTYTLTVLHNPCEGVP